MSHYLAKHLAGWHVCVSSIMYTITNRWIGVIPTNRNPLATQRTDSSCCSPSRSISDRNERNLPKSIYIQHFGSRQSGLRKGKPMSHSDNALQSKAFGRNNLGFFKKKKKNINSDSFISVNTAHLVLACTRIQLKFDREKRFSGHKHIEWHHTVERYYTVFKQHLLQWHSWTSLLFSTENG